MPAVGDICTFGPYGPKYRVERVWKDAGSGEELCEVRILETGEQICLPLSRIADNPEAL